MSDPTDAFRQRRWVFSLGLGGTTFAALAAALSFQREITAGPASIYFFLASAFGAYTLTKWGESRAVTMRSLRVVALTALTLLFAIPLLLAAFAISAGHILLLVVMFQSGAAKAFGLLAVAVAFAWSLLFVFAIHPRLSTQTASR